MAPVGRSDFKGFPPAIASTQFEAIENGSQVERSIDHALTESAFRLKGVTFNVTR